MKLAVHTEHISKTYQRSRLLRRQLPEQQVLAVSDVSLSVPYGELFGLLGPNGAGKTTLVKMMCTLILPSSGTAKVAGIDLRDDRAIRKVTGLVVSDERSFYWRLSVQRNMEFFAALNSFSGRAASERISALIGDVHLTDRRDQRFSDLSSGMRQRLAIARALIHEPKVLFLDEPTRSLDPVATGQLHDLLLHLQRDKGISIVLITHDLAEAEKMCARVALMHKGEIRAIGAPGELRSELDPRRHYVLTTDTLTRKVENDLAERSIECEVTSSSVNENRIEIGFIAGERDDTLSIVLEILRSNGAPIYSIDGAPPSLEEVFSHYTEKTGAGSE